MKLPAIQRNMPGLEPYSHSLYERRCLTSSGLLTLHGDELVSSSLYQLNLDRDLKTVQTIPSHFKLEHVCTRAAY